MQWQYSQYAVGVQKLRFTNHKAAEARVHMWKEKKKKQIQIEKW